MYVVSKRMEIAGAHRLELPYESKCSNIHGHNWVVTVYCCSSALNSEGMVVDFAKVKSLIHGQLDHSYVNAVLGHNINPTAENMAKWIAEQVTVLCETGLCFAVTVQESEGNIASYIDPLWSTLGAQWMKMPDGEGGTDESC